MLIVTSRTSLVEMINLPSLLVMMLTSPTSFVKSGEKKQFTYLACDHDAELTRWLSALII